MTATMPSIYPQKHDTDYLRISIRQHVTHSLLPFLPIVLQESSTYKYFQLKC